MTLAYLGWVPDGDAGIKRTLATMRDRAVRAQVDPLTVDTAHRIVLGESPRNTEGYALAIREWLRDNFRFVPDSRDVDTMRDPHRLLEQLATDGKMTGDCDDLATLAAAFGLALGMSPRFVVLGFPSTDGQYAHVFTELEADGGWIAVDTTKPRGPVESPSRTLLYPI